MYDLCMCKYEMCFPQFLTLSVRSRVAYSSSYIFGWFDDINFQNDYHPSVIRHYR